MNHALYASQQALKAYREASYHERLNIMVEFFEETLPITLEEMVIAHLRIEALEEELNHWRDSK
jgi:hypothetical protein